MYVRVYLGMSDDYSIEAMTGIVVGGIIVISVIIIIIYCCVICRKRSGMYALTM